jgi:acetyl-CoA acetyltransferase
MSEIRTLRGKAAVVGLGESKYFKHGKSPDPEFKLALQAIVAACKDAGIDPRDVDGFASFSDDRSQPVRLGNALGIRELRFSSMQWAGGGGGAAAAVGNAAAGIIAGMAECIVVFRSLAQGQVQRFGLGPVAQAAKTVSGDLAFQVPYGAISPAQRFAMQTQRFMHEHGVKQEALRAIALAAYHHAQANPRAVMHGRPLDAASYDASRWIVEPFHLYDCCQENDGAAALIVVAAERAKDFPKKPVYLLGSAAGSDHRFGASSHNTPDYGNSGFTTVARRLYEMAKVGPKEVDVLQSYENFTGCVAMSMYEHGFFKGSEANDFLTFENLTAPNGRLPINTSGGNLAECYVHGFGMVIEAARQVRGESPNQAKRSDVSMMTAGPMIPPVSSLIFGSEATL